MAITFGKCIEWARTNEDVLEVVDHAIKHHTDEGLMISDWPSGTDILDIRIRVMRVYAPLHDLEEWEPEQLTKHDKARLEVMRKILANCDKRRAELYAKV